MAGNIKGEREGGERGEMPISGLNFLLPGLVLDLVHYDTVSLLLKVILKCCILAS